MSIGNLKNEADLKRFVERVVSTPGTVPPSASSGGGPPTGAAGGDLGGTYPNPTVPGLAGKANTSHTHPQSDIANLTTDLAAKQPLDSDLTAIAALSTTTFGRSLLALADAAAARTSISAAAASHTHAQSDITGLVTDLANKQPLDGDLTLLAALSTAPFGRSLLELAGAGAARTALGLVIGTDIQAYDSDLAAIAALSTTTFGRSVLESVNGTDLRTAINAAASTHTHAQSDVTNLVTDLAAKAPLASPTFTGNPTAPTPTAGDNDTSIATTAFVTAADTAASTADRARANHTGTQLANTISDFNAAVRLNRLDQMAAPTANVAMGANKITGLNTGTASSDAATTGQVNTAVAGLAPLASPALTGTPTAPSQPAGDNSTKIATTAYADGAVATASTADRARANHTGTQLASTISDFNTAVRTNRLDQMAAPTAAVSLNSQRLTSLADGVANNEAVNLGQMNTAVANAKAGQTFKPSCKYVLDITALPAHTRSGNVLTASANGALPLDPFGTPGSSAGDRVLVVNSATGAHRGIYTVTAAGSGLDPWVLTRAADAVDGVLANGAFVTVQLATFNAGVWESADYLLTTPDPIVVNTTSQTWEKVRAQVPALARCRATRTANQLIANTTQTVLTFPTEDYDSDAFHSLMTNTGRLTIPSGLGGDYLISAVVVWESNATGWRQCLLNVNGAAPATLDGVTDNAVNGVTTRQSFATSLKLNAGDYIEVVVNQNSGANRNITNASFQLARIGS